MEWQHWTEAEFRLSVYKLGSQLVYFDGGGFYICFNLLTKYRETI